jgi:hypothetical protein
VEWFDAHSFIAAEGEEALEELKPLEELLEDASAPAQDLLVPEPPLLHFQGEV